MRMDPCRHDEPLSTDIIDSKRSVGTSVKPSFGASKISKAFRMAVNTVDDVCDTARRWVSYFAGVAFWKIGGHKVFAGGRYLGWCFLHLKLYQFLTDSTQSEPIWKVTDMYVGCAKMMLGISSHAADAVILSKNGSQAKSCKGQMNAESRRTVTQ